MKIDGYLLYEPIAFSHASPVWRALDPQGQARALQVLSPPPPPAAEQWFARLEAVRALKHWALVGLEEILHLPDGQVALVSELVEGHSLEVQVAARRPQAAEVQYLGQALASALQSLHLAGLVHGDISPANLCLAGDGAVKLGDLCALPTEGGTSGFAAPEREIGGVPTPAGDIYSMAAVLDFALGHDLEAALRQGSISLAQAQLLRQALALSPESRPSASDFLARWRGWDGPGGSAHSWSGRKFTLAQAEDLAAARLRVSGRDIATTRAVSGRGVWGGSRAADPANAPLRAVGQAGAGSPPGGPGLPGAPAPRTRREAKARQAGHRAGLRHAGLYRAGQPRTGSRGTRQFGTGKWRLGVAMVASGGLVFGLGSLFLPPATPELVPPAAQAAEAAVAQQTVPSSTAAAPTAAAPTATVQQTERPEVAPQEAAPNLAAQGPSPDLVEPHLQWAQGLAESAAPSLVPSSESEAAQNSSGGQGKVPGERGVAGGEGEIPASLRMEVKDAAQAQALLALLLKQRDIALMNQDEQALAQVSLAGTPLAENDLALLRQIRQSGAQLSGVSTQVESTEIVAQRGAKLRLSAVLIQGQFQKRDRAGRLHTVEQLPAQSLEFILQGRPWKLVSVIRGA